MKFKLKDRPLLCLFVAWALCAPALGQETDRAHGMNVGDVWRYSASLDVLIAEERDAQQEMGRLVQTAHLELEAVRESADGGLVVRGRFDRLTSVWRRGNVQFEFSWTRPAEPVDGEQEEAPDPMAEGEPAPNEAFRAAHEFLARRPFEIVLSDSGRVRSVSGLAGAAVILERASELDPSALGMFLPPRFAEHLQPIWRAEGAGPTTAAGDEWTRSRRIALGPAGAMNFETHWTADKLRNGVLTCSGKVEAAFIPPDESSLSQPAVEVLRGAGDAKLEWSAQELHLLTWQEKLDLATRWSLGDLEIVMTQLSTRRLNRLD